MFFIALSRYKFAGRHLKKADQVLEAGCGQGVGSVMLTHFAGKVIGVDYDPALIQQCRQQYGDLPNLEFDTVDLREPFPEHRHFDAVVSLDVIEHFEPHDAETVIRNLAAVLKEGGLAVIGTPNKVSAPYASARRKASHPVEYDPRTFDRLLSFGFQRRALYAMTDEVVSTGFMDLAWYLMAVCWK